MKSSKPGEARRHRTPATLGGKEVHLLAYDPKVGKVQVRLPSGEVVVAKLSDLSFGDTNRAFLGLPEKPPPSRPTLKATPRKLPAVPTRHPHGFTGEINDTEGHRFFFSEGARIEEDSPKASEKKTRQQAEEQHQDYMVVKMPRPMQPADMTRDARQFNSLLNSFHREPMPDNLLPNEKDEWNRLHGRLTLIVGEFMQFPADQRNGRNPEAKKLNDEVVKINAELKEIGNPVATWKEIKDGAPSSTRSASPLSTT